MKGVVPLNRAAVSHRHFAGRNTPRAKQGKIIVLCHRLSENKRETSHTGLMLICHKNNTNISGQGMQGKRWKPLHSHSVHFCLSENPPSPSFTHLKQLHLSAIRQNCGKCCSASFPLFGFFLITSFCKFCRYMSLPQATIRTHSKIRQVHGLEAIADPK